jgi:hypothetical protein
MVLLYLLSAGTVLIIGVIAVVYLLWRGLDLLERIAVAAERMEARDRQENK